MVLDCVFFDSLVVILLESVSWVIGLIEVCNLVKDFELFESNLKFFKFLEELKILIVY